MRVCTLRGEHVLTARVYRGAFVYSFMERGRIAVDQPPFNLTIRPTLFQPTGEVRNNGFRYLPVQVSFDQGRNQRSWPRGFFLFFLC